MNKQIQYCLAALLLLTLVVSASATNFTGTTRIGWTILDEEGSLGVNQPTYNLYEGPALSLEKYSLTTADGVRFYGDLRNITLNNRNLKFAVQRPGKWQLSLKNNQYRRTYSNDGSQYTRRRVTDGQFWVQPIDALRIFGGVGGINKHGNSPDLFELEGSTDIRPFDYTQTYANAGVRYSKNRRTAQVEYRQSKFKDVNSTLSDRNTQTIRVTGSSPCISSKNLIMSAGFQNYKAEMVNRRDTLTTNSVWGAARRFWAQGYDLKYSFLWDRARRTGDVAATDNIIHGIYATRTWLAKGGATAGYRYRVSDNAFQEETANGYFFSGWYKATANLTLKGGYGSDQTDVTSDQTLVGDESVTRYWAQVKFSFDDHSGSVRLRNRKTENEEIGSIADYDLITADLNVTALTFGAVYVGYTFADGEYVNSGGTFNYEEHVLNGEFRSEYDSKFQWTAGATYARGKKDVDWERSSLRFSGTYAFRPKHRIEVIYTAHNYDNYIDPSPIYSEYYTANVVQINLIKDF